MVELLGWVMGAKWVAKEAVFAWDVGQRVDLRIITLRDLCHIDLETKKICQWRKFDLLWFVRDCRYNKGYIMCRTNHLYL